MNRSSIAAVALVTLVPLVATPAPALAHAAPARADSYTVTARISTTVAIGKETTLKVRGRVTPKAAGQKVVLQQRVGTKVKWNATGTSRIRSNGTYVLKDAPSTPCAREYRVLKPAFGGIAKGVSKPLAVEVYTWERLAYRVAGGLVNVIPRSTTIGTTPYDASLVTDKPGVASAVEYTLGRKCTYLRASYAVTDEATSGSSGWITVSTDGEARASHALAVGSIVADHVIDIAGVYRLRFDFSTTAVPAGVAAVATPEVLCTR